MNRIPAPMRIRVLDLSIFRTARRCISLSVLLCLIANTNLISGRRTPASSNPISPILAVVSDSIYTSHVLGLQAFGIRKATAPNRDSVSAWIHDRFISFGLTDVAYDNLNIGGLIHRNVVATISGSDPSAGELIVCAHYDSESSSSTAAPGADDNASGTAAVLEMARVLKAVNYRPAVTLRFIAFAAEELGMLGSDHFANDLYQSARKVVHVQNYDMIGYLAPGDSQRRIRIIWYDGARDLAERDSLMMRTYTTLTPVMATVYRDQSDSWPFAQRGFKAFFNIENSLTPYYHTSRDSASFMNMSFAAEVTKSGLALLVDTDQRLSTQVESANPLPAEFALEQNYPNPFNPSTTLSYELSILSHVDLRVCDLFGREVVVLVNEEKMPGTYTVRWDAGRIASGTYFCELRAAGRVFTKKMLLLR